MKDPASILKDLQEKWRNGARLTNANYSFEKRSRASKKTWRKRRRNKK